MTFFGRLKRHLMKTSSKIFQGIVKQREKKLIKNFFSDIGADVRSGLQIKSLHSRVLYVTLSCKCMLNALNKNFRLLPKTS